MPQDFAREIQNSRASGTTVLRRWIVCLLPSHFAWLLAIPWPNQWRPLTRRASSADANTWTVVIVLPPRVVAGYAATLAVLDVNGRLAPGITVDIGNNEHVTTDNTGRAFFSAPSLGEILIAKASGASAAALIDSVDCIRDYEQPMPPAADCVAGGHGDLRQPSLCAIAFQFAPPD